MTMCPSQNDSCFKECPFEEVLPQFAFYPWISQDTFSGGVRTLLMVPCTKEVLFKMELPCLHNISYKLKQKSKLIWRDIWPLIDRLSCQIYRQAFNLEHTSAKTCIICNKWSRNDYRKKTLFIFQCTFKRPIDVKEIFWYKANYSL